MVTAIFRSWHCQTLWTSVGTATITMRGRSDRWEGTCPPIGRNMPLPILADWLEDNADECHLQPPPGWSVARFLQFLRDCGPAKTWY